MREVRRRRQRGVAKVAVLAAVAAVGGMSAATRGTTYWDTWVGLNGSWSNGAYWGSGVPNNNPVNSYDAVISQGVVALDVDATVNQVLLYNQAQIGGSGHTVTVTNLFNWEGGYFGYVNATPTIHLDGTATLTMAPPAPGASGHARLLWGTIDSYGVTNYTGGGAFYINSGASFNNYGQFNLATASGISNSYGLGQFANMAGAVFNKNGTDAATVTPNFSNAGSVLINAGTLQLEQVTNQSGGVINAAAGTTLVLHGSTNNYLAGSDVNGPGAIQFTYGTHNFEAGTFHPGGPISVGSLATVNVKNTITPSSVGTIAGTFNTDADQAFNDVTLTGGIGGAGTVTLGGNFLWTAGNLYKNAAQGAADNGRTVIAANAQAVLLPSSTAVTSYRIIDNNGTVMQNGGVLNLNNGGVLNNKYAFYANGGTGIYTTFSPGTVNNTGAFNLIAPVTYTVGVPFNNAASGVVNVDQGTLVLAGGGSDSGFINVVHDATLKFDSAMTHNVGSGITGAGNLWFSNGINDLSNTSVATTGTVSVSTNATGTFGNALSAGGTTTVAGTIVLNTKVGDTGDQTFGDLALSGILGGSRRVVVTDHLDWLGSSSTMNGTGHTVIAGGATADLSGYGKSLYRALDVDGTLNDAAQNFYANTGSSVNVGSTGTFNLIGAASVGSNNGVGTINVAGTINKTGTGTATVGVPLNDAAGAAVNVAGGTLALTGSGTHAGTINVAGGALLSVQANQGWSAGAQVTGAGGVEFTYGTSDMSNAMLATTGSLFVGSNGTLTLGNVVTPAGPVTVAGSLTINKVAAPADEQVFDQLTVSGSLYGSRDVRVTGGFTWTGSSTVNGTGRLTLGPGVVTNVDGSNKAIGRPVVNEGTLNHTAGNFNLNGGSSFTNDGTFNGSSASGISSNNGVGSFANNGTFNKSGTAAYPIAVPFTNGAAGTVNVNAGSVSLASGADSGAINVAAGAALTFTGSVTHNAGSVLGGAGSILFTGGTHVFPVGGFLPTGAVSFGNGSAVTVNNTITPSGVGTIAGAVTFNADESFNDVTMAAAVGGTGNLTFGGTFTWPSGAMSGSGTTTLPAGSSWLMTSNNTRYVSRNIDSSAAATLSAGTTYLTNNSVLTNRGTMDASTTGLTVQSGGGSFANVGLFNKNGTGAFTLPGGAILNNTGTIRVNQGTLVLSGGGSSARTINVQSGGALQIDTSPITFAPGSNLTGFGAINFAGASSVFPAGTYSAAGPLTVGSGASVTFNNAIAPVSIAPIAGTLVSNAGQSWTDVTLSTNGTLGGSGDYLITGRLNFNGGTMNGTGTTTLQVGSVLDMSAGGNRYLYRPLVTGGTVNFSGGTLTMYGTSWQLSSGMQVTGSTFLSIGAGGATTNNVLSATGGLTMNMNPGGELYLGSGVTLDAIGAVNVYGGKLTLNTRPVQLSAAGVLGAGSWTVGDTGNINLPGGPNVTTVGADAVVTLYGPNSKFDRITALATNNGSFTLQAGRAFTTAGALNNAGYIRAEGTGTTLTTIGALTNSGQIEATLGGAVVANGAVTSTGMLHAAEGSTITIKNGLTQTGGVISVEGTMVHAGGTSTVSAFTQQYWDRNAQLQVTGGTLTLAGDAGGNGQTLWPDVSGTGVLKLAGPQRLRGISVDLGGRARLVSGGASTLWVKTLLVGDAGKLDIADGRLIVDDEPSEFSPTLEQLRNDVLAGRVTSSVVDGDALHRKGIAFADAGQLGVTSWGGIAVAPEEAVARVTWLGDANMDGVIDADDFALLDRGYLMHKTGWIYGDFDYSGTVDEADYLIIDRVVAQQSGVLSPALLAERQLEFGPAYVSALIGAVPEPASAGLLVAGGAWLAAARRRRVGSPR